MKGTAEAQRRAGQIVGRWRRALQAQGVRIRENPAIAEIDRTQLVAQVAKAMVQQGPCRRRLAAAGIGSEQCRACAPLDGGGVQEKQVATLPLEPYDDVFLEPEEQIIQPGGTELCIRGAMDRIAMARPRDVIRKVGGRALRG